jgi:hypothetical protein
MSEDEELHSPEDMSEDDILDFLDARIEAPKEGQRTARDERIIAGFEEIVIFVEQNNRLPMHGEDRDIFERLYATRLDCIRNLPDARELLGDLDTLGILDATESTSQADGLGELSEDDILRELGVTAAPSDITVLRHVVSSEERRAAEEYARRTPCEDFEQFRPIFDHIHNGLQIGTLNSSRFGKDTTIVKGESFILEGVIAYIADVGETFMDKNDRPDSRLRIIYSNGTESNLLARSLQKQLWKDETGRRIQPIGLGGLFGETLEEGDVQSGTIYVLRSKSDHPDVLPHRDVIHKIGVTGGSIATRISHAKNDATFLLADVEVVAEYKLVAINRTRLEKLIHKLFSPALLDLTIHDRFGNPVKPREWFLVPLPVIDEAVDKIREGSILHYFYDPKKAMLVRHSS